MSTQQSGLVAGNKQNEAGGATGRSRSRFPLSYSFFKTERFAEYDVFYVQEGVSGDRLPLHSNHEVQTYTLKSPVLQNLLKKKDYFVVPMQAILPLNWEKFYTNPNIGEDVPSDSGLGVQNFWSNMRTLFNNSFTKLKSDLAGSELIGFEKLEECFKFFIFFERIYSTGSLMESLGISGHNFFRAISPSTGIDMTFDEMEDVFYSHVASFLSGVSDYVEFTLGGQTYQIRNTPRSSSLLSNNVVEVTLREALELFRDDMSFTFSLASSGIDDLISTVLTFLNNTTVNLPVSDSPLNLGRLWAYQLVCYHYYSNDHVDYIYSADLFRQYIFELIGQNSTTYEIIDSFSVNGYKYLYDSLSSHYFSWCVSQFNGTTGIFATRPGAGTTLNKLYAYFTSLFGFNRSLRFMDYFTGARTWPLAVGDSTVNVNSGKVSVIDLSRSSMMTKFLQAVNRSGRKFGAYMQELFGITPKYDYHNPLYLAHTSDLVGSQETDNTAEAQVTNQIAVTSRLRATSSRYAFEFEPDRDCIVIGITYYDLPRVYSRATERQNFFIDRFDMFNPYMQFIGDQSISEAELGTDTPNTSLPFAYTNRHMEYKQRYNQCSGGFCVPSTGLDHWIFIADELRRKSIHRIGPSFIRSFNSEIDKFYQGLSGYSLGTYFHFIVRYDNRMDASRPMAYNPTINV